MRLFGSEVDDWGWCLCPGAMRKGRGIVGVFVWVGWLCWGGWESVRGVGWEWVDRSETKWDDVGAWPVPVGVARECCVSTCRLVGMDMVECGKHVCWSGSD